MTQETIKKSFSALLSNAPESKTFASMVEILNRDGYVKKEKIVEICSNYNTLIEKVYEELAHGYLVGEVNNESQRKVINHFESEIDDMNNILDANHPTSKGINTMTGQDFKDYVVILDRHETEIIEFIKSKE